MSLETGSSQGALNQSDQITGRVADHIEGVSAPTDTSDNSLTSNHLNTLEIACAVAGTPANVPCPQYIPPPLSPPSIPFSHRLIPQGKDGQAPTPEQQAAQELISPTPPPVYSVPGELMGNFETPLAVIGGVAGAVASRPVGKLLSQGRQQAADAFGRANKVDALRTEIQTLRQGADNANQAAEKQLTRLNGRIGAMQRGIDSHLTNIGNTRNGPIDVALKAAEAAADTRQHDLANATNVAERGVSDRQDALKQSVATREGAVNEQITLLRTRMGRMEGGMARIDNWATDHFAERVRDAKATDPANRTFWENDLLREASRIDTGRARDPMSQTLRRLEALRSNNYDVAAATGAINGYRDLETQLGNARTQLEEMEQVNQSIPAPARIVDTGVREVAQQAITNSASPLTVPQRKALKAVVDARWQLGRYDQLAQQVNQANTPEVGTSAARIAGRGQYNALSGDINGSGLEAHNAGALRTLLDARTRQAEFEGLRDIISGADLGNVVVRRQIGEAIADNQLLINNGTLAAVQQIQTPLNNELQARQASFDLTVKIIGARSPVGSGGVGDPVKARLDALRAATSTKDASGAVIPDPKTQRQAGLYNAVVKQRDEFQRLQTQIQDADIHDRIAGANARAKVTAEITKAAGGTSPAITTQQRDILNELLRQRDNEPELDRLQAEHQGYAQGRPTTLSPYRTGLIGSAIAGGIGLGLDAASGNINGDVDGFCKVVEEGGLILGSLGLKRSWWGLPIAITAAGVDAYWGHESSSFGRFWWNLSKGAGIGKQNDKPQQ